MADERKQEVDAMLDQLLEGKRPEEVVGQGGLLEDLTKRLLEGALEGELTEHLGYENHAREGTFEPQLVPKGQRRLPGFDEKVIALYARGMTTREIQAHLKEIYKVEVSPSLISTVTDAVLDDVKAWQGRPLEPVYPIIYLDAIHVKMRTSGHVQTQAVYLALALTMEGEKELLGLWVGEAEGAKFWCSISPS